MDAPPPTHEQTHEKRADLSPTGLYTAGVWAWAKLPFATLLDFEATRIAFRIVTFVLGLARLFTGRRPSLPHSLVQRHVILDALVLESGATSVIELAAGLSARGVRLTALAARPLASYVEVDQPAVVAKKRELLERTVEGRAALARPGLRFVGGDALTLPLAELAPGGAVRPFVLAEGLLMYLDAAAQRELFHRVATFLRTRGGGGFAFDLVPRIEQPKPGRVGALLGRAMKAFTRGGDFVQDERTRADVEGDLRAAGFDEVRLIEPGTAPSSWNVPFLGKYTQQLVFAAHVSGDSPE